MENCERSPTQARYPSSACCGFWIGCSRVERLQETLWQLVSRSSQAILAAVYLAPRSKSGSSAIGRRNKEVGLLIGMPSSAPRRDGMEEAHEDRFSGCAEEGDSHQRAPRRDGMEESARRSASAGTLEEGGERSPARRTRRALRLLRLIRAASFAFAGTRAIGAVNWQSGLRLPAWESL